jgi:hypothetical protein
VTHLTLQASSPTRSGSRDFLLLLKYYIATLWLFNIAMENGPLIDDFPIKKTLNNQRVNVK